MTFGMMKALTSALAAVLLGTTSAQAAELTTFENCTDATGHTLAAEADETQPMLVRTVAGEGRSALHYNSRVLPRLSETARLFFYAHQCARSARGPSLSLAQARQADCIGLNTLLAAGLLSRDALPALQAELEFSAAEWELLPGPPRAFDLAGCRPGTVLHLPAAATPPARQTEWNACVRACADRLWHCQKACRGEAGCEGCIEAQRQCKAACTGP